MDMYRSAMRFPEFEVEKNLKGSISCQGNMTLFRSNSYMNESGHSIARAVRHFRNNSPGGILCILHDEMESKIGTVKLRFAGKGKGHNGIRSCIKHLEMEDFARIAIGISRPESRESAVVTQWVLGKFTSEEMQTLSEKTLIELMRATERLTSMSAS